MLGKLIAMNNLLIYMVSFIFNFFFFFCDLPPANKVNFSLFFVLT